MLNFESGIADTAVADTRPVVRRVEGDVQPQELERGAIVGRYMVLRKLGAGGMGVVYAAHDPELDRRVALKLLLPRAAGGSVSAGHARLLREAQALAKLAHPNVVAVHDVGMYGEGVWVAMELVDGHTLGAWAARQHRRWPEVLHVLTEAARGVAAAHDAGLVHRDLKPDNVMIGSDGRVRVMDFGLAHGRVPPAGTIDLAAAPDKEAPPELAALASRLTRVGAIQGTPLYMAPEQWLGQEAGAAADQFGWSVMAWELLYGERPFAGDTVMTIATHVLAGQRRPPAKGRVVPKWLRRVVERGLTIDPRRRWPTMEALLAAIHRGMTRSRAWLASTTIAGIATLAAGASYRFAPREALAVTSCREAPARPQDLWDAPQKERVREAMRATGAPFAEEVWQRVDMRLDHYASAWASEHAAACEQHLAGTQSSHLLDLRNVCLARRQSQVSQLVDIFAGADRVVVENAVQAVDALPSIRFCADIEGLLTAVAPPADERTAERVGSLRAQLERAVGLEATGLNGAGLELATQVRAEAEKLGYVPLTAEAALTEASALITAGRPAQADISLARAITLGLTHDLHTIAAEAAARRVFVMSDGLGRPAEALVMGGFAQALVERAGNDSRLAALLSNNLGAAHERSGDRAGARTHYEHSLAIVHRGSSPGDAMQVVIHHNLGGMYFDEGELEQARFHYSEASRLCTEILGGRHPLGAHPLAGLGDVDARQGRPDAATRHYEAALTMMEASYGPEHLHLLHPLTGLGRVHELAGRSEDARRHYERAVRIGDLHEANHILLAESLTGLASLAAAAGDPSQARALSGRARQVSGFIAGHDAATPAAIVDPEQ
jgi:tetratricopeptide (TPR) repeat protein/predicted Ser/Thr protein kinase